MNEHKFKHRINATSPICKCGIVNEENQHFLMHCLFYNDIRQNLHDEILEILDLNTFNFDDDFLCSLMVHGDEKFPFITNKTILEATIKYIKLTKRFKSVQEEN